MTDSCSRWPAVDRNYKDDTGFSYKVILFSPRSLFYEVHEDTFQILQSSPKRAYKMLIIVVLIAIIQGQISSSEVKDLPIPYIHSTDFGDPLQFTVYWKALDSGLKNEPILGYKVHVWETPYVPRIRYKQVDGELIRIAESPRRRKLRLQKTQYKNSTSVLEGADTTSYRQVNLSLNITYEVKVQVFTNIRDGPLSTRTTFTLH